MAGDIEACPPGKVLRPQYGKQYDPHIEGKLVDVCLDASIADMIDSLNKAGYTTDQSCSGIFADHPGETRIDMSDWGYVSFKSLSQEKEQNIIQAAKKAGLDIDIERGQVDVSMPEISRELAHASVDYAPYLKCAWPDKKIAEIWNRFGAQLLGKDVAMAVERGADFWNLTTTDMPLYDQMIKNPEYFRKVKGYDGKIVWMDPEVYMMECAIIQNSTLEAQYRELGRAFVEDYRKKMLAGVKFPIPVLDYALKLQEGRNRAIAAKQAGAKKIPVLVVNLVDKPADRPVQAFPHNEKLAREMEKEVPKGYKVTVLVNNRWKDLAQAEIDSDKRTIEIIMEGDKPEADAWAMLAHELGHLDDKGDIVTTLTEGDAYARGERYARKWGILKAYYEDARKRAYVDLEPGESKEISEEAESIKRWLEGKISSSTVPAVAEKELDPLVLRQYPWGKAPAKMTMGGLKMPMPPTKGDTEQDQAKLVLPETIPDNAVIRTNPELDNAVEHLGYKSIEISPDTFDVIERELATDVDIVRQSQERLREAQVIPDEKLDPTELAHIKLARAIAMTTLFGPSPYGVYAAIIPPASDRVRTAGMYGTTTQAIYINLEMLRTAKATIDTLIHELAHHSQFKRTGEAEDLVKSHAEAMTRVAAAIVKLVSEAPPELARLLKNSTW